LLTNPPRIKLWPWLVSFIFCVITLIMASFNLVNRLQ
jgi:hypothetical protein